MFQRGQKIVILESSANKKAHPKVGDVGYLDNMYLFVNDRFILLDAFFFQYETDNKHNKDRLEKKRFIIDLGMKKNLKINIDNGVPIKFFVDRDNINLTSTGYATIVLNDKEVFVDYPLIHSNYGIWNSVRKNIKSTSVDLHNSKELYKIPYGHISLFSSKHNSKYRIESRSNNEFLAWTKSMMPIMSSMLGVFYNYKENILLLYGKGTLSGAIGDCFKKTDIESSSFKKYTKYLFAATHGIGNYMASGYYLSEDIVKLRESEKANIVRRINFVGSINNMFIQRLDMHYINRFNANSYREINQYIKDLWIRKGVLDRSGVITEIMPVIDIIKSIFYRALIMQCDTNEKIGPIQQNYLPAIWRASFENRIKNINKMKLDANNSSSALDRIYDMIK